MYTFEIWDKKSEVNRFPADEFMQHHGIKEDDNVYLIKQGKRVVCVQTDFDSPFALAEDGSEHTIEEMAQAHCEDFIRMEQIRQQQLSEATAKFLADEEGE